MTITKNTTAEELKEKTTKLFILMGKKYVQDDNNEQEKKGENAKRLVIDYKNTDSFRYFLDRISHK